MKEWWKWWIALWQGEDLSEMFIIFGLFCISVLCLVKGVGEGLPPAIAGGLLRHLMGMKKNGNGKPEPTP